MNLPLRLSSKQSGSNRARVAAEAAVAIRDYFNRQTTLVDRSRRCSDDRVFYEGNRALVFEQGDEVAVEALRICRREALTYHRDRKAEGTALTGFACLAGSAWWRNPYS